MRQILLVLLISLIAGQVLAESKIYTWTDADGNVHYGDRPPKDANADEVSLQGKKAEPVEVDPALLTGTWFGRQDDNGEVRIELQSNGAIRFTQTFPDQSVFTYQGIWELEGQALSVITEFIEEGGGGSGISRSVEPRKFRYTFSRFEPKRMTLIAEGNTYLLDKVK